MTVAKPPPEPILDELNALYPPAWLRVTARSTGVVKRERKVDPVALFWVLVLGFGVRLQRSLASLKRRYEAETDERLSDGSWYERFTPELVRFLKAGVKRGLEWTAQAPGRVLNDRLARFKDLLILDSTIVRLHESLAKKWPAVRSRVVAAGVKVGLLVSAVATGPQRVALVGERMHDAKLLRLGPWVKDRILLMDLGFFKYQAFTRIQEYGGFFVSRLKENSDPTITRLLRTVRGRSIDVEGRRLRDILPRLKREALDVLVEVSFRRRVYGGSRSGGVSTFRLVAVLNAESGKYHVYLTNIMDDVLSAEDVAALYSARWAVELVFKELKSRYALDVIQTQNPKIVEALIWTAILTLVVSRRVYVTVRAGQPEAKLARYTSLRWSTVFAENAPKLLERVLANNGIEYDLALLDSVYGSQALDPHVNRKRLMDRWVA